ncbi:CHAT domain-containing tetratricopeptide repeat protein [Calothrix sp. UHCC 0171]|uniref:CHAT domain-containing protein n=1 Tax=Calothrix sp. UHCC 0171 TaxID=3110245 RepID=UPI002B204753|nr:CHAT domain-containing tetratricopeptide repeat protein [Calothrix sp. UHCC 0171]MEA5573489.1 CHAT domain-containing tetratricopeptide repeat protein [Calothrix sp. UHCC 0171]
MLGQSPETGKSEVERLWNLCRENYKKNQSQSVLQFCQQAATTAETIGDRLTQAKSLVNLGNAHLFTGNVKQAIANYQQALAIAKAINERDLEGRVLTGLGSAYNSLGDYDKAIEYHQQVLIIARQINNPQSEVWALGNLGTVYNNQGKYDQAIDYYQKVLTIARQIKDQQSEFQVLGNLGVAYNAQGHYAKAMDYYQQSLIIARQLKNFQGEAQALNGFGQVYNDQGNYPKAIEYNEQSLAIAQQIKNPQIQGQALAGLGTAYNSLGEYAKAIDYYQQWLTIARQIKNLQSEGRALVGLGLASVWLGRYAEAIEYNQQSLTIARQIKDRHSEGQALGNIGLAYNSLGDYAKAIEFNQQSLAIARQIKDRQGEGRALNNLGATLQKSSKLPEAEKSLFEGIAVWESQRERLGSNDTFKVSIFEEQARTYRTLQSVLIAQNKTDKALEIAERGRARAFVELLQRRAKPNTKAEYTPPPLTIEQIKQIAKQQNATLVQYSIIGGDFNIEKKLQNKESELYIWVIKPTGEVKFHPIDLKPLWQKQSASLDDLVKNALKDLGVAIDNTRGANNQPNNQQNFVVGDLVRRNTEDRKNDPPWKVIAVNPQNRTVTIKLPTWTEAETPIERTFAQVTKVSYVYAANKNLQQLHRILIEPIADSLPKNERDRVIFIPQGSLFFVPFPALQDANRNYLIDKHTIQTSPSIQVLDLTRQQRQKLSTIPQNKPQEVLVVGNPTMPYVPLTSTQLPSLPHAEEEAKQVAQMYNTNAIVGNRATKSTILPLLPKARIIHLATHGLLDDFTGGSIPGAIALAPEPLNKGKDGGINGLLTASEIFDLQLNNTELVVLSACDTGRGKITGDGVIGLSRSWISAGVPSVVVSLWSVDDDATKFLMGDFYQRLKNNSDKASALRDAMLATKRKNSDPRYWAAFTLIGETN